VIEEIFAGSFAFIVDPIDEDIKLQSKPAL
jgi:hypothetical protein